MNLLSLRRSMVGCLALALLVGCKDNTINSKYGVVDESGMQGSVNGTGVLADMFAKAGHQVSSTSWLTPRVNETAEVIVWFPDSTAIPPVEARDWLESWLEQPGHTLIYVGRDHNAAVTYWTKMAAGAPANLATEIQSRRQDAEIDLPKFPLEEDGIWFKTAKQLAPRKVTTLAGPWAAGIDPAKVEIVLNGRLIPADDLEILLKSERDALVSRKPYYGESQLILVENGSFLLNLPLVNHEHRKLAGKLIAEIPQAANVVFLESGPLGPDIRETDLKPSTTGLEIFALVPFDSILLHLAAAGLILCMMRWPIFGPPRPMPVERQSDFGEHITALGKLLQRTGDRGFAMARVTRYYEQLRATTERKPTSKGPPSASPSPPAGATETTASASTAAATSQPPPLIR